MSNLRT